MLRCGLLCLQKRAFNRLNRCVFNHSELNSVNWIESSTMSLPAAMSPNNVSRTNSSSLHGLQSKRNFRSSVVSSSSTASSESETLEFRAETKQLLDIVTHSIYTDKEVFMRELISNASDALEKLRYKQVQGEIKANGSEHPQLLEISILTDKDSRTLTVADNGIGMTRDELIGNLGTIARSGSKQFVESLKKSETEGGAKPDPLGIIGQFGVGFYSSFMVADTVTVESISATDPSAAWRWSSDGSGHFTVEPMTESDRAEGHIRGSRVVMKLKEKNADFALTETIKGVIKKYSNFVSFPIKLNGEQVNTVTALWAQEKSTIKPSQYAEFYRFITGFGKEDEPRYTLHYRTDAPIDLKVLFFVPFTHTEKFGGGHMERGVNLYSRKVLIESKPTDLLPTWLRFIKGAVDSEDLPLSLSREKPQDSNLLRRIREVTTRKFIRFLEEQLKDDRKKYREFYLEFSYFLKEGVCSDPRFSEQVAKLVMFESSALDEFELCTLDEYIARCAPEHKEIYYLCAPNRKAALQSPYMEAFKKNGREVLLLYQTIDDFVMSNVKMYGGRKVVSAEESNIDFGNKDNKKGEDNETEKKSDDSENKADNSVSESPEAPVMSEKLTEAQSAELCSWLKTRLGRERVREVKTTTRLHDSPAIITDHESGNLRKMMKMVEHANLGGLPPLPPQQLEINPGHPIIVSLYHARASTLTEIADVATLVAEQLFDNALIAAGLTDDPRSMLPRLNKILRAAMTPGSSDGAATTVSEIGATAVSPEISAIPTENNSNTTGTTESVKVRIEETGGDNFRVSVTDAVTGTENFTVKGSDVENK